MEAVHVRIGRFSGERLPWTGTLLHCRPGAEQVRHVAEAAHSDRASRDAEQSGGSCERLPAGSHSDETAGSGAVEEGDDEQQSMSDAGDEVSARDGEEGR